MRSLAKNPLTVTHISTTLIRFDAPGTSIPLTTMTQTLPPLPFPPPSPFPPSPLPFPPSFPFQNPFPVPFSLFPLLSLSPAAKRPPEIGKGERFSSLSEVRGGAPTANAFWAKETHLMAATYNTIINMTHISRGILPPWGWNSFPLEPNWTQVASTSPSVDAPATRSNATANKRWPRKVFFVRYHEMFII